MAKLDIQANSTSHSEYIFIQNSSSTTGAGLTGLVFNTASLTAYYAVERGAATAITLVTLASATAAWASGGFIAVDGTNMPGLYRFDVPNALFSIAATKNVVVMLKGATNMAPVVLEYQIVAYNPDDSVRLGLTALPSVTAGAINGLPLSVSASGAVNTLQINGTAQTARDIGASVLLSPGTGAGQIALSTGAVTVGTNNDKSNYSLAAAQTFSTTGSVGSVTSALGAAAIQSIWDDLTVNNTVVGSVGKLISDNLNATVSSRSTLAATDVWSATVRTITGNGDKTGYSLATAPPTAAAIADAVWDEALSGHLTVGTTGEALNSSATVTAPTAIQVADAVLNRKLDSTGNGTDTLDERTVRSAFRAMRNKVSVATGTMTVYKEDDTTTAWSGTVSNTSDVTVDPTG